MSLANTVAALTEQIKDLTAEVHSLTKKRRKDRVVSAALVLMIMAIGALGFEQARAASYAACQATNSTNASLLRLINSAASASLHSPPAGSTPLQAVARRDQYKRGQEFLTTIGAELAPKKCTNWHAR